MFGARGTTEPSVAAVSGFRRKAALRRLRLPTEQRGGYRVEWSEVWGEEGVGGEHLPEMVRSSFPENRSEKLAHVICSAVGRSKEVRFMFAMFGFEL